MKFLVPITLTPKKNLMTNLFFSPKKDKKLNDLYLVRDAKNDLS